METSLRNNGCNKCQEVINGVVDQTLSDIMALDTNTNDAMGHPSEISLLVSSLTSKPIPPFLLKTFDMLSNDETSSLVTWAPSGTSFIINDPHLFAANVLPDYFRHNNFQSFVTQLNSYGFKKISWDKWEYKNDHFRRGERHLLRNIKRRNSQVSRTLLQVGESETLMKEHNLLITEITMLKEKQQMLEEKLTSLKCLVETNERDQTKMMLTTQKILCNMLNLSNGAKDDDKEPHIMGKRKLEDVVVCLDDEVPDISKGAVLLETKCETVIDEQQMEKHPANTFISLEDFFEDMSDFTDTMKGIEGEVKPSHDINES